MKKTLLAALMAACVIFTVVGYAVPGVAFAATVDVDVSKYTDVLDDLQRDETFDAAAYPAVPGDYSLEVFQIAESTDGELFLYVYQPGGDVITLSSANISQDEDDLLSSHKTWLNYDLLKLNVNEVFSKYLVVGLEFKTAVKRYYDITSVLYAEEAESDAGLGNVVTEVPIAVGRCFIAQTKDGDVSYYMEFTEVVTITNKLVGSFRYSNGFYLSFDSACDSHWVAFSTDKDIDQLYQADISYHIEHYCHEIIKNFWGVVQSDTTSVISEEDVFDTVNSSDTGVNDPSGLFAHRYKWNRIQSASDFMKDSKFTPEAEKVFKDSGYQWVLRFYESSYTENLKGFLDYQWLDYWSEVSEVMILRLNFRNGMQIKNLGVVDNKQQGDNVPDNTDTSPWDGAKDEADDFLNRLKAFFKQLGDFFDKFGAWCAEYWWVLAIVGGVIVIGLLSAFFKPVWTVVKWILLVLYYIISAPARLIVFIATKAKERHHE